MIKFIASGQPSIQLEPYADDEEDKQTSENSLEDNLHATDCSKVQCVAPLCETPIKKDCCYYCE